MRKRSKGLLRVLILFMAILLFASSVGGAAAAGASTKKYGLTVDKTGTLLLNGKPYNGYGVNYYSAFTYYLQEPWEQRYIDGFALLKKYNIPFIRMPFCNWGWGYYAQYDQDKANILSLLDHVVAEAEKNQIGIIADLMWSTLSFHVGEKESAMGDLNSKTMKYAKEYTAEIVKRYADSPAIWGWEIGNEYNLSMDICDPTFENLKKAGVKNPSGFDFFTSVELRTFYKEIATEIRKYDPYRMISNGNGEMRATAFNLQKGSSQMDKQTHIWQNDWTADTLDEWLYMNAYMAPAPLDTISFHWQLATLLSDKPQYNLEFEIWGRKKVPVLEILKEYVTAGKKAKKAVYFGEFGDFMDMEEIQDKQVIPNFSKLVGWMDEAGIQIATSWQFSYGAPELLIVNDTGSPDKEKLQILSAQNLKFKSEGKQDIGNYWPAKTPVSSQKTGSAAASKASSSTVNSGPAASGTASEPAGQEVSSFMLSSSTLLEIDGSENCILLDTPMTLELFTRSIKLKDGYSMKVFDADRNELTGSESMVGTDCAVTVYGTAGEEIRTFKVALKAGQDTAQSGGSSGTQPVSQKGDKGGTGLLGVALIVLGSLLVLGGAGAAVYFLVIRKRTGSPKG